MERTEGYKFVEHTADVEYIAYGKSMEMCFKNALMGMFDTMSYINKVSKSKTRITTFSVKDSARSLEDLLWYALQDTLSIADSKGLFAYKVSRIKIKKNRGLFYIDMSICGKGKRASESKLDVKGVSRYNLSVKTTTDKIAATVVLDV